MVENWLASAVVVLSTVPVCETVSKSVCTVPAVEANVFASGGTIGMNGMGRLAALGSEAGTDVGTEVILWLRAAPVGGAIFASAGSTRIGILCRYP